MNSTTNSPTPDLIVNTGPLIAPVAAIGSLDFLAYLYARVLVPSEVERELRAGGSDAPELVALRRAGPFLGILPAVDSLPPILANVLDLGEASVIHQALQNRVPLVAIDEKAGRRIARLHGLAVTGSLGILLRANKEGLVPDLRSCIRRMRLKGIWVADALVLHSLRAAGEPSSLEPE
jgi:predicted nucleic acid-binding protein